MSIVNDPKSPMYVPEKNRRIARERTRERVGLIADYLDVRDLIPTGTKIQDRISESRERILEVLGGTEEDWRDYRWHLRNAIRDTETLSRIVDLSADEMSGIEKTATRYRWQISPYYASLMDRKDRGCPIFKQAVPTARECPEGEEVEEPYALTYNSPAPLVTRLYADRIIINVTNICAAFCRHCLRKKDISLKDMVYPKEDVEAALDYVAGCPEIRDVLLTGGDALALGDDYIDWILTRLDGSTWREGRGCDCSVFCAR